MLKAITFDLDNTLIDFMAMKRKASDAAAKEMVKHGLRMNLKEAKKKLFQFYLKEGIEGNLTFTKFLKLNNAYSELAVAAALNAYTSKKYQLMKPYRGTKPALIKLKKLNLKLGIISDAPKLKMYQRLETMKLTKYFDEIVGYEDTGKKKPSKLPFIKILKLLKVKPKEAMHVGDNPQRDMNGAKSIGMRTCLATYGQVIKARASPDFKISSIRDIPKIAKAILQKSL